MVVQVVGKLEETIGGFRPSWGQQNQQNPIIPSNPQTNSKNSFVESATSLLNLAAATNNLFQPSDLEKNIHKAFGIEEENKHNSMGMLPRAWSKTFMRHLGEKKKNKKEKEKKKNEKQKNKKDFSNNNTSSNQYDPSSGSDGSSTTSWVRKIKEKSEENKKSKAKKEKKNNKAEKDTKLALENEKTEKEELELLVQDLERQKQFFPPVQVEAFSFQSRTHRPLQGFHLPTFRWFILRQVLWPKGPTNCNWGGGGGPYSKVAFGWQQSWWQEPSASNQCWIWCIFLWAVREYHSRVGHWQATTTCQTIPSRNVQLRARDGSLLSTPLGQNKAPHSQEVC